MNRLLLLLLAAGPAVLHAQPQNLPLRQTKTPANEPSNFSKAYQYYTGVGRPLNKPKAIQLFRDAAVNGDPQALNAMGNLYLSGELAPNNSDSAILCYKQAAQKGYAGACLNLGQIYQRGELAPQDFAAAARYYTQGAALGNVVCQCWVAYMSFKGIGMPQDYDKAFSIYSRLAQQGFPNAMYFLGVCYRNGYGTAPNAGLAKEWLKKAIDHNEVQAIHELYNESLPENKSVVNDDLQQQLAALKAYHENVQTSTSTNLEGTYQGYAVYYDFSGKYVQEIVPLTLTLKQSPAGYSGKWTEADTLSASIKMAYYGDHFAFDSSSHYVRHNRYSYYGAETYRFDEGDMQIKYLDDSMFLAGDMRFYSLTRGEPGQPMYISLARKISQNEGAAFNHLKLKLSPNPATDMLNVAFSTTQAGAVSLRIMTIDGQLLPGKSVTETLPAGDYTVQFRVQDLPAASYVLVLTKSAVRESKVFIIK